jgi:type II secretory pathway component PulM
MTRGFTHHADRTGMQPMKRARAIAIAQAEQKAREARLLLAAGLLLLPALLLLLLIGP